VISVLRHNDEVQADITASFSLSLSHCYRQIKAHSRDKATLYAKDYIQFSAKQHVPLQENSTLTTVSGEQRIPLILSVGLKVIVKHQAIQYQTVLI
jgi:hypothetical protein